MRRVWVVVELENAREKVQNDVEVAVPVYWIEIVAGEPGCTSTGTGSSWPTAMVPTEVGVVVIYQVMSSGGKATGALWCGGMQRAY